MNFQSILIVTYGRSGSTLLQGILNSHEDVIVHGENYHFCNHLFKGYKALKKAKNEVPQMLAKDPFFGNSELDVDYYLENASEMVRKVLFGNNPIDKKTKALGFKEIRYESSLDDLAEYLDFLKLLFPNPVFVFNTRDNEAVVRSRLHVRWIKEREMQKAKDSLTRVESIFDSYAKNNPNNTFQITYEEVITKSQGLMDLHQFLGLEYSQSAMNNILGKLHSYTPVQSSIKGKEEDKPKLTVQETKIEPLVTVLLCTYNDEAFIAESIQSILDQSYRNIEFIILNDGSTDNTKAIIHSFDDSRIRYLEHEQNKGLEDSKNWGLSEAEGKYIAYIDGDDIAIPERIYTQVKYMESNPDVGLCASAVKVFGDKSAYYHSAETNMEIRCRALVGTPLNHPSCMIRSSVLKDNSIRYRKDFPAAEDHPFMVDLLCVTKAYCFPKVLLHYRWHEQNISVLKKDIQEESAQRAIDSAFIRLADIKATAKEKKVFKQFWRGRCEPNDIEVLEGLRDKIYIDKNLSERDSEFRYYLKKRLTKAIDDLYQMLIGYQTDLINKDDAIRTLTKEKETLRVALHSANYELKSIANSISWKLTTPIRWIGVFIFRLKARK